jgi:hypothetical protein
MSEDLTKLSGPELAERLIDCAYCPDDVGAEVVQESARRHREDTRVWQRNLERERDMLRGSLSRSHAIADRLTEELAESKRLLGTMAKADLEGARDSERLKHWRKWAESFSFAFETNGTDGAVMNAIAVKLHDAETRAESAENRLEAEINKPIPVIKLEAGDAYVAGLLRDLDHWKSKALGTQAQIDRDDRIAQGMSTAELVAELERMREKRDAAVKALDETNANMERMERDLCLKIGEGEELAEERLAHAHRLQERVSELEEGQRSTRQLEFCANGSIAGIDKRGCYQVASDGVRHEADPRYVLSVAAELIYSKLEANDKLRARIAELEEQLSLAQGSMTSMQHNAERRLKRVMELEAQLRDAQNAGADEWTADGEAVPPSAVVAHTWGAGKGTTPLSEPAERKPHEWRWTVAHTIGALEGSAEVDGDRSLAAMAASHLRELLDERKRVEALADSGRLSRDDARAVMEVLNGKR